MVPESRISIEKLSTYSKLVHVFHDITKAIQGLGFISTESMSDLIDWNEIMLALVLCNCHGNRLTAGPDTLSDLYKRIYLWRLAHDCIKICIDALKEPDVREEKFPLSSNATVAAEEEAHTLPGDVHAWISVLEFNLRTKFKVVRRCQHCDQVLQEEADHN